MHDQDSSESDPMMGDIIVVYQPCDIHIQIHPCIQTITKLCYCMQAPPPQLRQHLKHVPNVIKHSHTRNNSTFSSWFAFLYIPLDNMQSLFWLSWVSPSRVQSLDKRFFSSSFMAEGATIRHVLQQFKGYKWYMYSWQSWHIDFETWNLFFN